MDNRRNNAQDVLRCHLCETPAPPMYCDICNLNLCKPCVGEHLSDESTEHKVVPFRKRGSTLYCSKHSTKLCDLHCEQCDIPICVQCVSSGEHLGHKQGDIVNFLQNKNEALERDLRELENLIYPKYQEIEFNISVQKVDLSENTKKLKKALDKQGENLHREIDNAIKKLKTDVDETESKALVVLDKKEDEIKCSLSEIKQIITNVKKVLNSNDVSLVTSYRSSIAQLRRLPPKLTVSLPSLMPQKINKQQIYEQFGSLSAVSITPEGYGYFSNSPGPLLSRLHKMELSEEQQIDPFMVEQIQGNPYALPFASDQEKMLLRQKEKLKHFLPQQFQRIPQQHNNQDYQHPNQRQPSLGQDIGDFSSSQLHEEDIRKSRSNGSKIITDIFEHMRKDEVPKVGIKRIDQMSDHWKFNKDHQHSQEHPQGAISSSPESYLEPTHWTDPVFFNCRSPQTTIEQINRYYPDHRYQYFVCTACNRSFPRCNLRAHLPYWPSTY